MDDGNIYAGVVFAIIAVSLLWVAERIWGWK
jgi:hypothetical protein